MQVNEEGRGMLRMVETVASAVNLLLAFTFYVANANHSTSGFAKTGLGFLAEIAFLVGLAGLGLLIVGRRKIKSNLARLMLIMVVTIWNQACLIAFLTSLIPFRLP